MKNMITINTISDNVMTAPDTFTDVRFSMYVVHHKLISALSLHHLPDTTRLWKCFDGVNESTVFLRNVFLRGAFLALLPTTSLVASISCSVSTIDATRSPISRKLKKKNLSNGD